MRTKDNLTGEKKNIQNQVMWNRLLSVVEEQGQTLVRTAFSPIVRECGDISAGVFDLEGRMMAQAVTGTPGHVNSMAESVKHFIDHFPLNSMNEGDIFITNDPWMGTGHLNDFVITTPCFKDNKIVGLFSCTSHLTDIGGLGVGPDATDIHMEGLYIPMLKLADKGVMDQTLLKLISQNTRQPVETEGDVYSLAACNDIGCKRLVEMMEEFEISNLKDLSYFIYNKALQAVEKEILIESKINFDEITPKFFRILKQFEPFGPGNKAPLFLTENLKLKGKPYELGKEKEHIKMNLKQDISDQFSSIGFWLANKFQSIENKSNFSAVYSIEENNWKDRTTIQLNLKDFK